MQLAQLVEHHRCIAIIGMEKNAGKTTVLNHLLGHYRGCPLAVTSIGYDGEDTDLVTGTAKPRIYIERGTIVATAAGLLDRCDITRELLLFTGLHTAMGEVLLLRALSDGYVQLAGPAITAQMQKLLDMIDRFAPAKIFIDGAAARRSSAAIAAADACILATGASFSPLPQQIVEHTAFCARLLSLPICEDNQVLRLSAHLPEGSPEPPGSCYAIAEEATPLGSSLDENTARAAAAIENIRFLFCNGAFSNAFARTFLENRRKMEGLTLVAVDGTRFLLSLDQYNDFIRRKAVFQVTRAAKLVAVTLNPTAPGAVSLPAEPLRQKLEEACRLPVFNVGI